MVSLGQLAGLIPILGTAAGVLLDLTNASISMARGEEKGAGPFNDDSHEFR